MHGSIDEAKVDVSVEHVEVDGGASINDGRHRLQNLCRTRENSDNGMRQSPRRTPNLSFSCLSWALVGGGGGQLYCSALQAQRVQATVEVILTEAPSIDLWIQIRVNSINCNMDNLPHIGPDSPANMQPASR